MFATHLRIQCRARARTLCEGKNDAPTARRARARGRNVSQGPRPAAGDSLLGTRTGGSGWVHLSQMQACAENMSDIYFLSRFLIYAYQEFMKNGRVVGWLVHSGAGMKSCSLALPLRAPCAGLRSLLLARAFLPLWGSQVSRPL